MARITVEDCLEYVDNRFDLVLTATKRSRDLVTGAAEPVVEWENDKVTVVALREIAAGYGYIEQDGDLVFMKKAKNKDPLDTSETKTPDESIKTA